MTTPCLASLSLAGLIDRHTDAVVSYSRAPSFVILNRGRAFNSPASVFELIYCPASNEAGTAVRLRETARACLGVRLPPTLPVPGVGSGGSSSLRK